MTRILRPRQVVVAALLLAMSTLATACAGAFPNSTFSHHTEFARQLTSLWNSMMFWGILVFVLVETLLVYAIIRYRRRPNSPEPEHVHGNTPLEITWTLAPAVILALIAVPTVQTIFRTQAPAPAGSLEVQVTGHQWWWEFSYPQYGFTTANELYLPVGRTVNFTLRTNDVIHSFWIPQLGGKRDLVSNRTNHLWFTTDSTGVAAYNGSCNEYCGSSHANMRFRVYTVQPEDFEKWAAHEKENAVFGAPPTAPAATLTAAAAGQPDTTRPAPAAPAEGYIFPLDQVPDYVMPDTPIPRGLEFPDNLLAAGDAQRGMQLYSRSICIGCHKVRGNPVSVGVVGPDLTHVGSRHTIAAGLYPNDARHLARWIKNARRMKPLSQLSMPTLGMGEFDPITKTRITAAQGGLTDQQIADLVAYLLSLK